MNILIIKLGAIGDVLRTTAVLPALKEKYEDCDIGWVTKPESFDILKNNEFIDKIYLIDEDLKEKLKDDVFDLIMSLDDEDQACELVSGLNSKKIIGVYIKKEGKTYTEDSAPWFDLGLISKFGKEKADELKALNKKTYQEILFSILNIGSGKYKIHRPILNLQKEDLEFAKAFAEKNNIEKKDLVIGINTGAGGRWLDKKLSIEKTAELIDKLSSELKCKLLLFGGEKETERNNKIKNNVKTEIIDAGCSNSLMEFASLVNLCNLLITSDSLALHVGVALKKKVVVFFAPTSSAEIELYDKGRKIIPKTGCLCCYKEKCDIPPDYNVSEIVEAVKELAK